MNIWNFLVSWPLVGWLGEFDPFFEESVICLQDDLGELLPQRRKIFEIALKETGKELFKCIREVSPPGRGHSLVQNLQKLRQEGLSIQQS